MHKEEMSFLKEHVGKRVVVVYLENGEERSVVGVLHNANDNFVAVTADNGSIHAIRASDVRKVKIKP